MKPAHKNWLTGFGWLAIVSLGMFFYFKQQQVPTGFKRGNIYQARQLAALDLKFNSWYISGLGQSRICLGNMAAPLTLLSCNYKLKDTVYTKLPFSSELKLDWHVARSRIDSPFVCLMDYRTPALAMARLDARFNKSYSMEGMHFDLMQLLSPGSVIVNGYEPAIGQKSVQKIWLGAAGAVLNKNQSYAHQLQTGGDFSIDGFITCNRKQNAVLFTYYYRNTFICLDTNLNLRYIGKTIDTNTIAKLNVEQLQVDGKKVETITGSPVIVNKRGYSDGNFFYLQAGLRADNERLKIFENPVTIDVYQLDTGAYCHSLYLPEYKGEVLSGFSVRGNMLIAIRGRYLLTYGIDTNKILQRM